jgi:hypothetical protein
MSDFTKKNRAKSIWTDYQIELNRELKNVHFSDITLQCPLDCKSLFFIYKTYKVAVDFSNKKQVVLRCLFGNKHWYKEESAFFQGNKLNDSSVVISCIKNSLIYLEEACKAFGDLD